MARRKRIKLVPAGKTKDGKLVVRGVFAFFDTYGLPLDVAVERLRVEGLVPDWCELYDSCIKAGWRPTSTFERLLALVGDVYGPTFKAGWEPRMREHIARSS
jgi:hypothetical protein